MEKKNNMTRRHLLVSSKRNYNVLWILSFYLLGITIFFLLFGWYVCDLYQMISILFPCLFLISVLFIYCLIYDRRIDVFDDRIEFHYTCNKELDYTIKMGDIDSYILDSYTFDYLANSPFISPKYERIRYSSSYRYFLKKDNRLYFYFKEGTYKNEDELLSVLNENFHLPFEAMSLYISFIEMKMAERGQYITLQD